MVDMENHNDFILVQIFIKMYGSLSRSNARALNYISINKIARGRDGPKTVVRQKTNLVRQ
jgi:hypothetical protein